MDYEGPAMDPKEKKDLARAEIVLLGLAVIGVGVIVWIAWK